MSNGLTPVIIFVPSSAQGQDIIWTALNNIQPPNVGYNFVPTNNDWVASHYSNVGGSYVYSYTPPVPPAQPNVPAFANAIQTDPTIGQTAQIGLNNWLPWLSMFIGQPSSVQAGWAMLISEYSGTWLTQPVQNAVETYAAQYNIPLMP